MCPMEIISSMLEVSRIILILTPLAVLVYYSGRETQLWPFKQDPILGFQ